MRRRSSQRGRRAACLGLVIGASVLGPTFARAQDTSVYAGVNLRLASGSFGSTRTTTVLYAPAVVRLDTHRFEFGGYFPFLMVNNGTVVLSEGGFVPMQGTMTAAPGVGMPMGGAVGGSGSGMMGMMGNAGTQPGQPLVPVLMHQSGFGDIVGSVGYRLVDDRLKGLQVVLSTRLKFPTASASNGLGTGRMDVGVVGTVRTRFDHGWFYGEGGYVVIGNPAGADLRNAVLWSAGAGRQIHTRTYLLASAFGNSAVVPQFGAAVEVGVGLGFKLSDRLNLTALPAMGLTEASPKYAITIGLSTDLMRR